jgi:hypothetical protein
MEAHKLPEVPNIILEELLSKFEKEENFQQLKYPAEVTEEFKNTLEKYILENTPIEKVGPGWINATKANDSTINHFDWHTEDKFDFEHKKMITMWLYGEENNGGQFRYITDDGNIHEAPLSPPSYIIIGTHTPHSVEIYKSKIPRISINLNCC